MSEPCGVGVLQIGRKCGFIIIHLGWKVDFFSYWKDPVHETFVQARGCSSFRNEDGASTQVHHTVSPQDCTG